MFPKFKRKIDKKLLSEIKKLPCLICNKRPSDPDHITTKGSGGDDDIKNLWPLCRKHHTERHMIGLKQMIKKYQKCEEWLIANERQDVLED